MSARVYAGLMRATARLLGGLSGTSHYSSVLLTCVVVRTSLDVAVVESNSLSAIAGKKSYDKVVSVVTLQLEKYLIGIGDFLTYSILASSALRILGLYGAIETSILILLGVAGTFEITKRRGKAPGLLLPVVLGTFPLIIGLSHI